MAKLLSLVFICICITKVISVPNSSKPGLKEAVVCEGKKSTISCKAGFTISVVQANYGRYDTKSCPHKYIKTTNCFSSSSTSVIRKSCNGRKSCSLYASNSVFGDPCVGTHKYIRVLYRCLKSIYNRVVLCEGTSRRIKCAKGQVINIISAIYGRRDKNTCPSTSIRTTSCSAYQSKNIIKGKCLYKNSCFLQASNLIFGDPCKWTHKYLSVSYRCMKPRHKEVVVCEGSKRLIMCPSGKKIRIHYANYGRTDVTTCPHSSIKNIRCFARNSMTKVSSSCNGKHYCSLRPFNSVFGDPCVGTYKYLRVYYYCL